MAHGSLAVRRSVMGALRDFTFGLVLFSGMAFALCASHGPAHALTFPKASASAETGPAQLLKVEKATYYATVANGALRDLNATQVSAKPTMAMLAFVFALLTMMNLAFVRHVRRAYLTSRPKAGKGA